MWVVEDVLNGDKKRAVEIDADVIELVCTMKSSDAYNAIKERYDGEELTYALIRWAFLAGVKFALRDVEGYENMLMVMNALVKLGAKDALKRLLRAEIDGDEDTLYEIKSIPL